MFEMCGILIDAKSSNMDTVLGKDRGLETIS